MLLLTLIEGLEALESALSTMGDMIGPITESKGSLCVGLVAAQ